VRVAVPSSETVKLQCRCGATIRDQTDFIPYKAYLVADEDWFDVLDDVDARRGDDLLRAASRTLWLCTSCGALHIDGHEGELHVYVPADGHPVPDLLRSHLLDRWKRPMAGIWWPGRPSGPPGELWWGSTHGDHGWEEFVSWPELERRYHEVFTRLRDDGTLRSAFLRRDGELVHRWPTDDG
jgi:hypothetical protein